MTPEALVRRSQELTQKGDLHGAIGILRQLASQVPSPGVLSTQASLHRQLCEVDEARDCLLRAWKLSGDDALRIRSVLTLSPLMLSREQIRKQRDRMGEELEVLLQEPLRVDDPVTKLPHLAFHLAYHGENDRDLQALIARVLRRATPSLDWKAPHLEGWKGPGRRVKVGFVSAYLKDHTIGRLNGELIRRLDRDRFEVSVFFVDGPQGPMGQEIAASADHAFSIPRRLEPARQAISAAGLDLLYYTDIGMDPFATFLAFSRLAPVQVVTWGHSMTTGLDTLDAWISGELLEVEGGQAHYTEPLDRLPDPTVTWKRPERPDPVPDRASLGLPLSGRVYLCPQNAFKLHPDFDPLIGEILRRDPEGHVVLLDSRTPAWAALIESRLRPVVGAGMERIHWLSRRDRPAFLATLAAADVCLDPLIYGGCNTSLEAIAMGTPVVTLPSACLRDRYTMAWYKVLGIEETVVEEPGAYVEKALYYARSPEARAALQARVEEKAHLLYDNPQSVRAHERLFEELLRSRS